MCIFASLRGEGGCYDKRATYRIFTRTVDADSSASNEPEDETTKKDSPDEDSDNDSNSNPQSPNTTEMKNTPILNGGRPDIVGLFARAGQIIIQRIDNVPRVVVLRRIFR